MDKLLTDMTVRRTAQMVVLLVLLTLISMQFGFVSLVLDHFYDLRRLGGPTSDAFIVVVTFPFQSEVGSFVPIAAGIVPLVFSSVCYVVDLTKTPAAATSRLNRTGHLCFMLLGLGIVVGIVNVVVSNIAADDISQMVGDNIQSPRVPGDDLHRVAVRNFFSSILSFQIFYLLHLVGFQR